MGMRPTHCVISAAALRQNLAVLRERLPQGVEMIAVVKANAYGHGAGLLAPVLEKNGVSTFAIATVKEAVELRQAGVSGEILLLGGPYGDYAACLEQRLTPVFSDLDSVSEWDSFLNRSGQRDFPCHLKFDTGMGRLGFREREGVAALLSLLQRCPELVVRGVMTHLAVADEEGLSSRTYTLGQLHQFLELAKTLKAASPSLTDIHVANSALSIRGELPAAPFAGARLFARPGLALYGVLPAEWLAEKRLEPVLSWQTAIHSVKEFPVGAAISYGGTFVTARPSRIAVLPVGYADGYPRLLSNRAYVLIDGKRAPVLGRVCMDLTMVDVSEIPSAGRGTPVVLLGRSGAETLSADRLAAWAETISYEVFCRISSRVERRLCE